jgi:hypothetical protein
MINSHAASDDRESGIRGGPCHSGRALPSRLRLLFCGLVGLVMLAVSAPASAGADDWFVDVTESSGLDFHYDNGATGKYYFPEIMGGGVALFDYNGNGLLDIYLVQGGAIGPDVDNAERTSGDRLFRNDSVQDESGDWHLRFTDVTEEAGIDARGYGMGVAIGDINNNGYPDIYVLNFGANQLWRNNGDGTFTEVTQAAGAGDERWSVSASFVDLTNNGYLDLYIANYVDYSFVNHIACRQAALDVTDYCSPSNYRGAPDRLLINQGDGTFKDVSDQAGISSARGHGLGVIAADFSRSGRPQLYVANDGSPNFLWINDGNLKFTDDAFLAGAAVNASGSSEAGMGVDAADFNRSGLEDIFITHMRTESNTLYVNVGDGWFEDRTARLGLGAPSLSATGFGTAWLDLDNDGWLDLVAVNGAVMKERHLLAEDDPFPYHQRNQIFANQAAANGSRRFADVTDQAGAAFEVSMVSRGAAFGDLNNNGRVDMVIANNNGPARVLVNSVTNANHWLGLRLVDADGRRDQTGAIAYLLDVDPENDAGPVLRRSRADGSYASANDPRVLFGLGEQSAGRTVKVQWPDHSVEAFCGLDVNRYHELRAGTGRPPASDATE